METLLDLASVLLGGISVAVDWLVRHYDVLILLTGITLLLYGTAMGIRYIWRRIKNSSVWFNYVRLPLQGLTYPVRKFHRRYTEKTLRAKMAKWEERVIADRILDVLYDEVEAGRISKARFRRMQTEMGNFFKIPDLVRRKTDKDAVKRRLQANKEYQIGPKEGAKLGPKPGENIVPIYEGLESKYLKRKKGKA